MIVGKLRGLDTKKCKKIIMCVYECCILSLYYYLFILFVCLYIFFICFYFFLDIISYCIEMDLYQLKKKLCDYVFLYYLFIVRVLTLFQSHFIIICFLPFMLILNAVMLNYSKCQSNVCFSQCCFRLSAFFLDFITSKGYFHFSMIFCIFRLLI